MSNLINQKGDYRGVITDGGLGESKNGLPQETLSLIATEVYDDESQEWLPADSESNEIMAYLVLFDKKDKPIFHCDTLKKVTGWDGVSFVTLSELNLADVPIQFHVEENTYQENTTLQVANIREYDAEPGRSVRKLDKEGVSALQAKYASVLSSTKAPTKPTSAPAKGKTTTKGKGKPAPKAPPIAGSKPTTRPTTTAPVGKCTADEAWDACTSLKKKDVTNEKLSEVWQIEVGKVLTAEKIDEVNVTPEQWFTIKEAILGQIGKV